MGWGVCQRKILLSLKMSCSLLIFGIKFSSAFLYHWCYITINIPLYLRLNIGLRWATLHSVSGRRLLLSHWQIYMLSIVFLCLYQVILSIPGFNLPGGVHFKATFRMWSYCYRAYNKWLLYLIHGSCNQLWTFSKTKKTLLLWKQKVEHL